MHAEQMTAELPSGRSTWANRPSASAMSGKIWLITDIGNGVLVRSDGTRWLLMSRTTIARMPSPVTVSNTTSDTSVFTFTLPGGLMNLGSLVIYPLWSMTNSANGKSFKVNFGGQPLINVGPGYANYAQNSGTFTITNTATNAQVGTGPVASGIGTSGTTYTTASINTENDVTVDVLLKMSALSETMTMIRLYAEVVP